MPSNSASDPARVIGNLAEVANIERYLLKEVDAGINQDERALMEALAILLGYLSIARGDRDRA